MLACGQFPIDAHGLETCRVELIQQDLRPRTIRKRSPDEWGRAQTLKPMGGVRRVRLGLLPAFQPLVGASCVNAQLTQGEADGSRVRSRLALIAMSSPSWPDTVTRRWWTRCIRTSRRPGSSCAIGLERQILQLRRPRNRPLLPRRAPFVQVCVQVSLRYANASTDAVGRQLATGDDPVDALCRELQCVGHVSDGEVLD